MNRLISTVQAYKDGSCRYIDDNNGFSKAENQLVGGIPELIEFLVPDAISVKIQYSDRHLRIQSS